MKATLEFDLPEELDDYSSHINGSKYRQALHDMYTYFRNARKYDQIDNYAFYKDKVEISQEDMLTVISMVEAHFHSILESYDVSDHV